MPYVVALRMQPSLALHQTSHSKTSGFLVNLGKECLTQCSNKRDGVLLDFRRAEEAQNEPKSRCYSTEMLDLNNTLSHIMVTQPEGNEPLKKQGCSDKSNLDKPPQTCRRKCSYQCTKERRMKTLNELFELDKHLGEVLEAGSLPHWTTLTYQRKRSLGWDKKKIAGTLSPLYCSVVIDPGPGPWQANLIKRAALETRAHTSNAPTESFCQIWINTNTQRLDCGMQLGDLGWASGIFGHLRSPVRAWMWDDSKREPAASRDLSPSMHLSHKQILPSLYSD